MRRATPLPHPTTSHFKKGTDVVRPAECAGRPVAVDNPIAPPPRAEHGNDRLTLAVPGNAIAPRTFVSVVPVSFSFRGKRLMPGQPFHHLPLRGGSP